MSAKLHPLRVTAARSRWRYFSVMLSAALHAAILATLVGLWTRLGGDLPSTMDIDLVMITDGSESYQKSPAPDDRSNDKAPVAAAAAPAAAPAQQAAALPPLPAAPTQVAPPVVTPAPVAQPAPPAPAALPAPPPSNAAVITLPPPVPVEPVKTPPPEPAKLSPPPPPAVVPAPAPLKPPPVAKQVPPKTPAKVTPDDGIDIPAPVAPSAANRPPRPTPDGGSGSSRGGSSAGEVAVLNSPAPLYPSDARERGQEGRVLVRARIMTDGTPQNVSVETSSGTFSLDVAAVDAVRNWRFRNTTGGPIDVTVPVRFTLSEAPTSTVASNPASPAAAPSPTPAPAAVPAAAAPAAPPAAASAPSSGASGSGASSATGSGGGSGAGTGGSAGAGQVAVLDAPAPNYPPESRSRGEEGRVIVSAQIGTDGQPRNVAVFTSSGSPQLDQAAVEAVRKWRFSNRSGHAVDMTVPIRFVLRPEN